MAITSNPTSLKEEFNKANPNTVPSALQTLKAGSLLTALPTTLRKKAAVTSPYAPAATLVVALPEDAKANRIFSAYARAGAGTPAALTIVANGAVPVAGQASVAGDGDVLTAAADAWTSIDVVYLPEKYDVQEYTLPVVANVLTLPAQATAPGAVLLVEAEALTGGAVGKKIVNIPGTAPAAGNAALSAALTTVAFNAADAVTSARVKIGVGSSVDVQALLEAQSTIL